MDKKDREEAMAQWDRWRGYIAAGGQGSWPRDAFESLLDHYDDKIAAIQPADLGDFCTCWKCKKLIKSA